MINYFLRFSKESSSGFEAGVGILYFGEAAMFPTFSFGYRYSPIDGGIIFQIAATPITDPQGQLYPWGGLA